MRQSSNDCPLTGRTALVTGAARGIGRAVAGKLARSGCDVVINYFGSHQEAASLRQELQALGRRVWVVQADVSRPESVDEMFETLRREGLSRLDIVVSNAASGVLRPTLEMTLKHWRWCLETNAFALALLAQRAVSLMGQGGRIVALSSLGSERAIPSYGFVGASKAALESLVRSLAHELAPRGIRVNVVRAGVVDTASLQRFPDYEKLLRSYAERAPAGPVLTADEVADAVFLLCLPEAEKITGHTLVVDGGLSISG